MTDRRSRHAELDTYAVPLADGTTVELYEPRFAEPPEAPARHHRVTARDRLDLLAARYLGDPFKFWRLVDANPVADPDTLIEPGRILDVPESSQ